MGLGLGFAEAHGFHMAETVKPAWLGLGLGLGLGVLVGVRG